MTSSNETNWQSWPEEELTSDTKTKTETEGFSDPSVEWSSVTQPHEVPAIQAIQGDLVFLVGGYTSNYTPHMNALYLVDLSQEQPSLQKIVTLDSP